MAARSTVPRGQSAAVTSALKLLDRGGAARVVPVVPELPVRNAAPGCDRVSLVVVGTWLRIGVSWQPVLLTLDARPARALLLDLANDEDLAWEPDAVCAALADAVARALGSGTDLAVKVDQVTVSGNPGCLGAEAKRWQ